MTNYFPTQFAWQLSDSNVVLGPVDAYLRHFAKDYISTPSGEFKIVSIDVSDHNTIYITYLPLATDCSDCDEAGITEGDCQCVNSWVEQIDYKVIDVYGIGKH